MMLPSNIRRVLIVSALLLVITPAIHACTCVTFGPCNTTWKQGQLIFHGKVTAKNSITRDSTDGMYNLSGKIAVHFSVIEIFSGQVTSQSDTVVLTGLDGGDCGYPFVVGQSYLVYASSNQGQLATSICTETRPAVMAGALIQQLRTGSNRSERAALFGVIGTAPRGTGYEDLIEAKTLAGVGVRAIGSTGLNYSTITDEYGVYSFGRLPADSYRLEIDLPKGLSTPQNERGELLVIPIGNTEEKSGCAVDVFARPAGRISGVVINGEGKPVAGFVQIISADPKEAQVDQRRGGLPGFTTDDGKFRLAQIPPGRYVLIFYSKVNGQISFRSPIRSQPIDIGFGQQIEKYEFKVQ